MLLKYNTLRLMTPLPELGALIPQRVTAALFWPSLPAPGGLQLCPVLRLCSPGKGRGEQHRIQEVELEGEPQGSCCLFSAPDMLPVTSQGHEEA